MLCAAILITLALWFRLLWLRATPPKPEIKEGSQQQLERINELDEQIKELLGKADELLARVEELREERDELSQTSATVHEWR